MFTLPSLRAEGEAIQFGYLLLALFWIAAELSLLAMTAVEITAFRRYLSISTMFFLQSGKSHHRYAYRQGQL